MKLCIQWEEKLLGQIDGLSKKLPYIKTIFEVKGLVRTATGILAENDDITHFTDVKQIQKLICLALVEDGFGKRKGRTVISRWGRKQLRYRMYMAKKYIRELLWA